MALPRISKKTIGLFVVGVLFLVLTISPSVYFYQQYQASQKKLANPQEAAKEEIKNILERVGKLMVLPNDEEPTVATVADREKIKDQQFFANSQNGDKVIIYTKARKAILYRPVVNKIIEIGPLNLTQNNPATQSAQNQTQQNPVTFKTELLNGAGIVDLTKKYEEELKAKVPQLEIVGLGNAINNNYTKTVLVDVAGNKSELANQLAQVLGISVSALPEKEATPTGDFLIIVGTDKK